MGKQNKKKVAGPVAIALATGLIVAPMVIDAKNTKSILYQNDFETNALPDEVNGKIGKDNVSIKDVAGNHVLSFLSAFDGTDNWDSNKHEFAFYSQSVDTIKEGTKVTFQLYIETAKKEFDGVIKYGTGSSDSGWNWVSGAYGDLTSVDFVDMGNGYSKADVETTIGESDGLQKLVLQIVSWNCSYDGEILIDNLVVGEEESSEPLPEVKDMNWDFNDTAVGVGGWKFGGVYEHENTPVISYDAQVGEGSMKIDVDYSKNATSGWSEIKLQNDLEQPVDFSGYNIMSYDFIYDATKMTSGSFKGKLFIDGVVDKTIDIDIANGEDIGNNLKKVKVQVSFNSKKTSIDSMTLSIVGASTNYVGSIYIDNISFGQKVENSKYVEKTTTPTTQEVVDITTLQADSSVILVDKKANKEVASLYAYLKALGKTDKVLYGHQNDTHHKAVLDGENTNSDTKDLTGSIAAVVGIDTLSLTGAELQLTSEEENSGMTLVQKAANLGIEASKEGAIITMSAHMPNFALVAEKGVDSNGNYDFSGYTPGITTGNVVSRIMPGGDLNQVYTQYLDIIAEYGKIMEENQVPVLFRPFHENNGSWFWWGKAFCDEEGYKNLYRYTVEYLRDTKDVHSFLYVYSPNGPFEDEADYLSRYPGDEFVDVLGFDMYHDNPTENASEDPWLDTLKETIHIVETIANSRGKLSAVAETGIRKDYTCMPVSGNANKKWFMEVSNIISQSNMPYYMVWANFDENNVFAPYMVNETMGHEMVNEFIEYYNDAASVFADGVGDYKAISTNIGEEYSYGYIVSPSSGSRILEPTTIRAKVKNLEGTVQFIIKDNTGKEMTRLDAVQDGEYYQAEVTKELLDNLGEITGIIELSVNQTVVGKINAFFNIKEKVYTKEWVDDFESYHGESVLLENDWATNVGPGCSLLPELTSEEGKFYKGNYGLAFNYKISTEKTSEGWAGMTKPIGKDWSEYDAIRFWIYPDGQGQKLVIQITTNGEDFEVHLPELASTTEPQLVTLKFVDFVGKNGGTIDVSNVERFGIWCNTIVPEVRSNNWTVESTMYFDEIKAVNTSILDKEEPEKVPPVDKEEEPEKVPPVDKEEEPEKVPPVDKEEEPEKVPPVEEENKDETNNVINETQQNTGDNEEKAPNTGDNVSVIGYVMSALGAFAISIMTVLKRRKL